MLSSTLGEGFAAELGGAFEAQMWRLAGWYCGVLESSLCEGGQTDTQALSMLGNAHYLLVTLIPDVLRSLPGQPPPAEPADDGGGWGDSEALLSMQPHGERGAGVAVHYVAMWQRFSGVQVDNMRALLCWSNIDYSFRQLDTAQARPSEKLQRLFAQAGALGDAASEHLGPAAARGLISEVLASVLQQDVLNDDFWEKYAPEDSVCGFGNGGVQQFVMDMRFAIAASAGVFAPESPVKEQLSQAVEKAVIAYCVSMDEELDTLLQVRLHRCSILCGDGRTRH